MMRSISLLVSAWLCVRLVVAQQAGWQAGQVNSTMCSWNSPRAAVIRDTLYIDGGMLWWQAGLADGTFSVVDDGNPLGVVYLLNFSIPFNTTPSFNLTTAFNTISKAASGGNVNNIGPEYLDGAMFANDYEWITYGGLAKDTNAYAPQDSDAIAVYQKYQYGPERSQFQSGYQLQSLPAGVTRYVTNGAGVSVPSENLGYYMGGLRSASKGLIYQSPSAANASFRANFESDTLIEVDLSIQQKETWSNRTLPASVPGRANAELVWVPVGKRGILVTIGGVINPSFALNSQVNNASATAESTTTSPNFMTTVSIYDIDSSTWYQQNTTGSSPGQLTQGCTVLASAQDGSSHNIYWYGGFDGLYPRQDSSFSDDVYVLSIPTFTWVKVKSGTPSTHGRAGHKCAKPYPDQMLVVGGYPAFPGASATCVGGGIIQIFNLSSTLWQDTYTPESWSNYTVPASVLSAIAGKTATFSNSSLETIIGTKYNTTKLKTWYPYPLANTTDNTNRTSLLPSPLPKPNGTPKYLAPVLGVVLGLIFISLLVLAFVLWRRRRYLKPNRTQTQSEAGTMDNRRWVTNWLRATPAAPADAKAPTVTTDETPYIPHEEEERAYTVPEMAGAPVLEMEDTSRPIELSGTGFVPLTSQALNGRPAGLAHSPSTGSHNSHASEVSRDSLSAGRPGISPVATPRADSPPLGTAVIGELPARDRVHSGISYISEFEHGHMRGISETSVSTEGAYVTPMGIPEGQLGERGGSPVPAQQAPTANPAPVSQEQRLGVVSPLTSPDAVSEGQAGDYLDAGLGANQKRKSQFKENVDDK